MAIFNELILNIENLIQIYNLEIFIIAILEFLFLFLILKKQDKTNLEDFSSDFFERFSDTIDNRFEAIESFIDNRTKQSEQKIDKLRKDQIAQSQKIKELEDIIKNLKQIIEYADSNIQSMWNDFDILKSSNYDFVEEQETTAADLDISRHLQNPQIRKQVEDLIRKIISGDNGSSGSGGSEQTKEKPQKQRPRNVFNQ
jgi:uncharacterized coiled-coil protein SlyX